MFRCENHHHRGEHYLRLAKVTIVKMSSNIMMWFIRRCGGMYYYLVLVSVCVCVALVGNLGYLARLRRSCEYNIKIRWGRA